ncbi:alpha-ketoglutarate-dependent dioxygenase AlkB [Vibrio sp. ZSDE26]|uniref:Alpha-ketoglutarate-dependent dioxygenase AlkB n=1 Tax=Vibrio amylolyticus TaxID=2847292 RepID=A0A9X1XGE2_9VIBR|nr:alpha-ketoglutarate-dependent dioxygenase AlkB [Vibrio amylolyticus]MCK6261746.1 alpha-ketoglutarate-dependent dioxygenase AlkB [Vibrio amylolyticus]
MDSNFQPKLCQPKQWHQIPNGSIYWDPNFVPAEEADHLFLRLKQQVAWRDDSITLFGKTMPIPRRQAWYGDASYRYSNLTLTPEPWLPDLFELKTRCEQVAHSPFNSVLANLYRDGNDSNGWHSDNEPELGRQPIIASISLGESRLFHLKHKQTKQKYTFELNAGSLLIMAGETQSYWLHTVPKTKKPKSERVNLTYRFIHDQT